MISNNDGVAIFALTCVLGAFELAQGLGAFKQA